MKDRITTSEELLEFTIERYKYYRSVFDHGPRDNVSRWYVQDFLKDLLLIQNFAHNQVEAEFKPIPNEKRVE
jgi:hypothetical protein